MQTGMLLLHAANGHANANSGEKKRRRVVKFSHKGKKRNPNKIPCHSRFFCLKRLYLREFHYYMSNF
jgi:hypothetical protein